MSASEDAALDGLENIFPGFSRGFIRDVLQTVGSARAIDKLLALGSEESGDSSSVDVAPSQLLPALFPHEQAPAAAASAVHLLSHDGSGSDAGVAAPALGPWRAASSNAQCNGHSLPSVSVDSATAVSLPAPPPPRPRTPEIAASAVARDFPSSTSASDDSDGPHRGWWPAWQQGGPVTSMAEPRHATEPGTPAASAPTAPQLVEDLLAVLQGGSDSDTGSNASSTSAYSAPSRGHGGGSRKHGSASRGYAPPMAPSAPAPHTPRSGDEAMATATAIQKTVSRSLLMDETRPREEVVDSKQCKFGKEKGFKGAMVDNDTQIFDYASWGEAPPAGGSNPMTVGRVEHTDGVSMAQPLGSQPRGPDMSHSVGAVAGCVGSRASGHALSDSGSLAHVVTEPSAPEGPVLGLLGQPGWDDGAPGDPLQRVAPLAAADVAPQSMLPHKRPGSAADNMYSLSKASHRQRGNSHGFAAKASSPAASSVAGDLLPRESSSVGPPDSEASLAFLVEAFQDQDPALLKDVLNSFDGDIELTVAKLTDMARDEEAHRVAASMQDNLRQHVEQEAESEEVRIALLQMQYPHFPLETVTTALEAQAGQMHGAATLLQLQADADKAAARVVERAETEAADAAVAGRLHELQLADAKTHPGALLLVPAASPEDLAAIAAMEAASQAPPAMRGAWPTSGSANSAVLRAPPPPPRSKPPPPPSYPRLAQYASQREQQKAANDVLYNSLRAPAQRLWDQAQEASDKMAKCFTKGRTAEARIYRNEATRLREEARQVQAQASDAIFRAKNMEVNAGTSPKLELHGLHVEEALEKLAKTFASLSDSGMFAKMEVITGRGLHSQGGAKLRPAVHTWLDTNQCNFRELPGGYEVYFTTGGSR